LCACENSELLGLNLDEGILVAGAIYREMPPPSQRSIAATKTKQLLMTPGSAPAMRMPGYACKSDHVTPKE
jgi:hypothetical protein